MDFGVSPNADEKAPNGEVPEKRQAVLNYSEICQYLTPFNFFTLNTSSFSSYRLLVYTGHIKAMGIVTTFMT